MKNLKIVYSVLALAAGLLFGACENKDFEAGPAASGSQVYFPNDISDYTVETTDTSITVPVKRIVADEAEVITIISSDESGLFTIPESVSFAAEETSADFVITFDPNKLDDSKSYPISLIIADEDKTTPYGNRQANINVQLWPWELLKGPNGEETGKFRDDWLTAMWNNATNAEVDVKINKHKSQEGVYMIQDLYGWSFLTECFEMTQDEIEAGMGLTFKSANIVIDASDPNAVVIENQFSGINDAEAGYGDYYIQSTQPGTLVDGIITFPKNGLTLIFDASDLPANTNGLFRIMLPGVVDFDYSLNFTYKGMVVDADNTTHAVLGLAYGADVNGVQYVVVSGDATADAAQIVSTIVDGSAQNIETISELEEEGMDIQISLSVAGIYTIVAVPVAEDKSLIAENAVATRFYFPGMGGEVKECKVSIEAMKVSEHPDASVDEDTKVLHDSEALAFNVSGEDLDTLTLLIAKSETVNSMASNDEELAALVQEHGTDYSGAITVINEKGYSWDVSTGLDQNTTYTLAILAKNIYGSTAVAKAEASTAEIVYTGELAIGDYTLTDPTGSYVSECVVTIDPREGTDTEFYIKNFGIEDGYSYEATYDPAAKTFSVSGVMKGYEEDGSLFGYIIGVFNSSQGLNYGIGTIDADGYITTDPCVFTVDEATKQLSALTIDYAVFVVDSQNQVVGSYNYFTAAGTIVTYGNNASQTSVSPKGISAKRLIPFSSTQMMKAGSRMVSINRAPEYTVRAASTGYKTVEAKSEKFVQSGTFIPSKTPARKLMR